MALSQHRAKRRDVPTLAGFSLDAESTPCRSQSLFTTCVVVRPSDGYATTALRIDVVLLEVGKPLGGGTAQLPSPSGFEPSDSANSVSCTDVGSSHAPIDSIQHTSKETIQQA